MIVVTVVAGEGTVGGFRVHDILLKPVTEEDLLAALRRVHAAPDASRPIIVVDDDAAALKLAERVLRGLGYRALCTRDAGSALEAAAHEAPAAIILDLLMPGMDRFEFLRRFRRTATGRRTPVIVWTVKELTRKERQRLQASAQAIVAKGQGAAALMEELAAHAPLPPR
ncbi:MAG: response regulator [Candidatus Rokubacteria bacterium]|nr:response regulator [Candidatus Rokubacteria bacterium]